MMYYNGFWKGFLGGFPLIKTRQLYDSVNIIKKGVNLWNHLCSLLFFYRFSQW